MLFCRYVPDYSRAQPLTWGRGEGCAFATQSCLQLMQAAALQDSSSPFCSSLMADSEKTYCTADGASVGSCNLVMYQEALPPVYQNFEAVEGVDSEDVARVTVKLLPDLTLLICLAGEQCHAGRLLPLHPGVHLAGRR